MNPWIMRAFDLAVPTLEGRAVHSNRGQAGIDGTIATAVGIAVLCSGAGICVIAYLIMKAMGRLSTDPRNLGGAR